MRNLYLYVVGVVALAACGHSNKSNPENSSNTDRDSLVEIINQKNDELNNIMSTFGEIQDGFRRINEAEGRVNLESASVESPSSVNQIRENISFIEETMRQNRDLIDKLRLQLRNSSFNATKLQKTIDNLSAELKEKAEMVESLRNELAAKNVVIEEQGKQIDNLNTDVSNLKDENATKGETVVNQDKQLNTAWFVFGTKSELREQKILQNSDVLRNSNFNKDYFTKIDIRVDKEIRLYSKSAKLLTNHPSGSYSLDRDSKGQYILHINNPTQFWSASKYLVVLVK